MDNNCDNQVPDGDFDGVFGCDGDCDDGNAQVNPFESEVCNGVDDDCNGQVDEGWGDNDGDGWSVCVDCDDDDASISPGATEVCDDQLDNDCDSAADCNDTDCATSNNSAPVADAGVDQALSATSSCGVDNYGNTVCDPCIWDFSVFGDDDDSVGDDDDSVGDDDDSVSNSAGAAPDGSGSFDVDGNVETTTWSFQNNESGWTFLNSSGEVPQMNTLSTPMTTAGTQVFEDTLQLELIDCNGMSDTDTVTYTFTCTAN